jgi:two-component system response regulator HydG
MSFAMQAKLLRVIQEREFTRVGGEEVIIVNVRIIAATNKDPAGLIKENKFREDLFYRLNVITLIAPPLRERREDIPLLADYFLKKFMEKNNKNLKGFTPQAMDRLIRHSWPGNVREMMNTIESAVVLSSSSYLTERDMPFLRQSENSLELPGPGMADSSLYEIEKASILNTLEAVNGNKSEAARKLGITRATLHKKLKGYGLS